MPSEQPTNKKKLMLVIFLGGIMVLSTLGVIVSKLAPDDSRTAKKYNNIYFRQENGRWSANVDGNGLALEFPPWEVESSPSMNLAPLLSGEKLYLSINPKEEGVFSAARDLTNALQNRITFQLACPEDLQGCEELPLKTCQDANQQSSVLILKISNTSSMDEESSCTTLQGTPEELAKIIDRALYTYEGVIA